MRTRWIIVLLLAMTTPAVAPAQTPWQFRWQKAQVLSYKVKNVTTVTEVAHGGKQQFGSRLDLLKRYRVADVDATGVATLEYSVAAMRNEQTRPDGDVLLFDSADPAKSTPGLREQLAKYVGTTLAVVRIDMQGKVIEVKQGPTDRYESEPPFTLMLPGVPIQEKLAWVRHFILTLDPPLGTGEKHKAQQKCECTKIAGGKATIILLTAFKPMPESVQERLALIQKEAEGEVVFDIA